MPSILIVEKNGNLKTHTSKSIVLSELYKKAGFKTEDGFKLHANWKVEMDDNTYHIHLYGKTNGRANQENKYDFPPPADNTLFFGNCVLANIVDGAIEELNKEQWEDIYEALFGGFEDLGEADTEDSEDEMDTDEDLKANNLSKTKDGYAKDGFVVDDEEEDDDDEYDESSASSDESEYVAKKKKCAKTSSSKKKDSDGGYECSQELEEEDYV